MIKIIKQKLSSVINIYIIKYGHSKYFSFYNTIPIIVILIIVANLFLFIFIQYSYTININNIGYYLFSTISQTIGALVAIVLTYFLTLMNSFKIEDNLFSLVLRKIFISDHFLITSISCSFLSIILSILGIPLSGSLLINKSFFLFYSSIVISLGICGIYFFVYFIINRASLYSNPYELFYKYTHNEYNKEYLLIFFSVDDYLIFESLRILLNICNSENGLTRIDRLIIEADKCEGLNVQEKISRLVIGSLDKYKRFKNNEIDRVYINLFNEYFSIDNEYLHLTLNIFLKEYQKEILSVISYYVNQEFLLDYLCKLYYELSDIHYPLYDRNLHKFNTEVIPSETNKNLNYYNFWLNVLIFISELNPIYSYLSSSLYFKRIYDKLIISKSSTMFDFTSDLSGLSINSFRFFWLSSAYILIQILESNKENDHRELFRNNIYFLSLFKNEINIAEMNYYIENDLQKRINYCNLNNEIFVTQIGIYLRYVLDIDYDINSFYFQYSNLFQDYFSMIKSFISNLTNNSEQIKRYNCFVNSFYTGVNELYPHDNIDYASLKLFIFGFLFPFNIHDKILGSTNSPKLYKDELFKDIEKRMFGYNVIQRAYLREGLEIGFIKFQIDHKRY